MPTAQTPKLSLPYIMPAQAQKHIPHNEALQTLDALFALSTVTDSLGTPPVSPEDNARYLVTAPATGGWLGKEFNVAMWREAQWFFYPPQTGWRCFIEDIKQVKVWLDGAWQSQKSLELSDGLSVSKLGINGDADDTNRLSLSSSNSLFNHAGQGHRLSINKQGNVDTASLVFQTNFSARAEFGLSGDDDFRIKVSGDGSGFYEALHIQRSTGRVSFPHGLVHGPTQTSIASFAPSSVRTIFRYEGSRAVTPRSYTISAVSGGTIDLTAAVTSTIFSDAMRNAAMVRLWNVSKTPPESCWVNYNNSSTQINIANASDISGWSIGDTLQLGDPIGAVESGANILGMVAVDISNYLFNEYGSVFKQKAVSLFTGSTAINGSGRLRASEFGETTFDTASLSDGTKNSLSMTLPCSVVSPVSGSHLLYFDERLDTGTTNFSINEARLLGVWV